MYSNAIKKIKCNILCKRIIQSVVLIHSVEVLILFKQLHVPNWRHREKKKRHCKIARERITERDANARDFSIDTVVPGTP